MCSRHWLGSGRHQPLTGIPGNLVKAMLDAVERAVLPLVMDKSFKSLTYCSDLQTRAPHGAPPGGLHCHICHKCANSCQFSHRGNLCSPTSNFSGGFLFKSFVTDFTQTKRSCMSKSWLCRTWWGCFLPTVARGSFVLVLQIWQQRHRTVWT